MPLSLEQYASYLDTRGLPWPAPPRTEPARAKPHLPVIRGIKAVLWNIYGTLLAIPFGELLFEHPTPLIMDVALDKTIEEFRMWGSMSRKPGQPAEYMRHLYSQELLKEKSQGAGGERFPEIMSERIWEALLKKLLQKDYKFDTGFFGSLNEYARKIAYFFHASLQATAAQPGAAEALTLVADAGRGAGLLADAQCFTTVQLGRGLKTQDGAIDLDNLFPPASRSLSFEVKARKPSDTLFRHALQQMAARGMRPENILHVGSRLARDIVPAKRLGMKTALYAGDKAALEASPEALKDPAQRPDALLMELPQVRQLFD